MESGGYRSALVLLLRECFEGMPKGHRSTWFVEGKEGIFDALDSVTAAQASKAPSEVCASIAAHAYHVRYILIGANSNFGGPAPVGTWNDSWKKQTATDDEWKELIAEIRAQYAKLLPNFSAIEPSKPNEFVGATALVPHCAFHLGAIRQIMKIV